MVPRELCLRITVLALVVLVAGAATLASGSPIDNDDDDDDQPADDAILLRHANQVADSAPLQLAGDLGGPDLPDEQPPPRAVPRGHHQQQKEQVRCFCNQPHCVSQGYMCRGRVCFTDLPLLSSSHHSLHQGSGKPAAEQHVASVYSGCLERTTPNERSSSCPPGKLCCDQDLCNHVDSPAMRLRLNKTLQVLLGSEHRSSSSSSSSGSSPTGQAVPTNNSWLDKWLRMATIAVPICGFVMILMLATLAARLLKPLPSPSDKLGGFRMPPETTPPLLGGGGAHLHPGHHLIHNKLLV